MYIKVHAKTYASEEKIEVLSADSLRIHVKEKPERGEANARILELLRAYCGPKAKGIRIEKGQQSPRKIIFVDMAD